MTDKARTAAAGAMNNVRTAIDSAKRIGFPGNAVSTHSLVLLSTPCVCLCMAWQTLLTSGGALNLA